MQRIAGYLKIFLPSSDPNDNVITNCSNKLFNSIQKTCSNELLNSGIYFTILKKRIFRVFTGQKINSVIIIILLN